MIRDFAYLDTERLRSFAAQLLEGVPDQESSTGSHEVGGNASAEAGFLSFVKGQGGIDYRYHRSDTETRSMHHHVYSIFEEALAQHDLLVTLDADFDFNGSWRADSFADGVFVRISGSVRCTDYAAAVEFMSTFPSLMKSFKEVQLTNVTNALTDGTIDEDEAKDQRRHLHEMEKSIKALRVDDMSRLGRTLYKEGDVRVKVRPDGAPLDHVLAGVGTRGAFLGGLGSGGITQSPPGTSWVAVGQISAPQDESGLPPMPTGNATEDAIEQMASSMRDLLNVGSGAVFPAMEFVPLAIYREVSN